jgi:hypothetical protein
MLAGWGSTWAEEPLHPELDKVKRYAPIVWLAPNEPFYPMIPHPFAFDGVNNVGSDATDFGDPEELGYFSRGAAELKGKRATLQEAFGRLLDLRRQARAGLGGKITHGTQAAGALRLCEGSVCGPQPAVLYRGGRFVSGEMKLGPWGDVTAEERLGLGHGLLPSKLARRMFPSLPEPPDPLGRHGDTPTGERPRTVAVKQVAPQLWEIDDNRSRYHVDGLVEKLTVCLDAREDTVVASFRHDDFSGKGRGNCREAAEHKSLLEQIQFWLYYPWDPEHPDDGEHVSVFVDHGADNDQGDHARDEIRAVVGAGHDPQTANNILVGTRTPPDGALFPRSLSAHMPFLAELGKHASAPDLNCNGRFDLGVDSNVAPEGVWGSRDVMTAVKKLKWGPFDNWNSMERDASGLLVEQSYFERPADYAQACGEGTRGELFLKLLRDEDCRREVQDRQEQRPEQGQKRCQEQQGKGLDAEELSGSLAWGPRGLHSYRLVPAADFETLYSLIREMKAERKREPNRARMDLASVASLQAFLTTHKVCFWGGRAPADVVIDQTALPKLEEWLSMPEAGRNRRDVWEHDDYLRPENDFKRWIFKRYGLGISTKWEGGNWVTGFVGRASGVRSLGVPDSAWELYAHWDGFSDDVFRRYINGRGWRLWDVGLDYNGYRTAYRGYYLGLGWNRWGEQFKEVSLDGGSPVLSREKLSGRIFLNAGYAVVLSWAPKVKDAWAKLLGERTARRMPLTLRVGIHGSVTRGTERDDHGTALAHKIVTPLEVQVALRIVYTGKNDKHPLAPR